MDLKHIWEPIWKKNPALQKIMEKHGNVSVYEYVKTFLTPSDFKPERQEEWLTVFAELLEPRLGREVSIAVTEQLRNLPLVSTADHHAPLDEPYWVNTNLVHSLAQEAAGNAYCIALSFASISLNTALGYPRGLLMHGAKIPPENQFYPEEKLLRLSYFGDKDKMSVVYGFRPFQKEDFERLTNAIQLKMKEGNLSNTDGIQLKTWCEHYFLDPDFLKQKDYSSQITVLNYKAWPSLFSEGHSGPRIVYLEIETLVAELLKRVHFKQPDSPLYKLLFTPEGRAAFVQNFEGVHGAFCAHENEGTYYFWGLDDKGHRVRLFLKDDCLHSETKDICITLTPEAFESAMKAGKIFPSMALCYIVIAFYYGLHCLGGSSQIKDLERSKQAWMQVLQAMNCPAEAESISKCPTQDLVGSIALSTLEWPSKGRALPTGIDLALLKEKNSFNDCIERAQKIALNEALLLYIKDFYIDFCQELPFPEEELRPIVRAPVLQ
ncbi:hypothetical protein IPG41_06195 [Candidatus Peregrinibacteria bacterium]|nr:MAG: hypothetical protein IPG41_06195 [Candidatus Peregrinibacteria bacterium]